MRFASTGKERTIEELAQRLYRTEGRGAATAARRARRALRDLNPQLADLEEVPEGTLIIAPDVEGTEAADEEALPPEAAGAGPGAEALGVALEAAAASMVDAIARERDGARRALKLLKSREAKASAKDDPRAAAHLERSVEAAEARLDEAKALDDYRKQAIKAAVDDLADFMKAQGARD
jgi:hypothetical protein